MPSDSSIISVKNVSKTFQSKRRGGASGKSTVQAVKDISLEVPYGEIFGLLGPNGAGKTTTMRMLSTLLTPTSGEIYIAGHKLSSEPEKIRREIGYVSQVGGMQRESTGRENIILQARLYGLSQKEAEAKVDSLLDLLSLREFADRKTSTYSGGQRRIFDLASGIVHEPKLLFLDEPSTGLDPSNRAQVWKQVEKLRERGTSVFLTTHYLDEADALCDRVAIVDHGVVIALGSPEELKKQSGMENPSLDDVFLKLTGHSLNVDENE